MWVPWAPGALPKSALIGPKVKAKMMPRPPTMPPPGFMSASLPTSPPGNWSEPAPAPVLVPPPPKFGSTATGAPVPDPDAPPAAPAPAEVRPNPAKVQPKLEDNTVGVSTPVPDTEAAAPIGGASSGASSSGPAVGSEPVTPVRPKFGNNTVGTRVPETPKPTGLYVPPTPPRLRPSYVPAYAPLLPMLPNPRGWYEQAMGWAAATTVPPEGWHGKAPLPVRGWHKHAMSQRCAQAMGWARATTVPPEGWHGKAPLAVRRAPQTPTPQMPPAASPAVGGEVSPGVWVGRVPMTPMTPRPLKKLEEKQSEGGNDC